MTLTLKDNFDNIGDNINEYESFIYLRRHIITFRLFIT